ncbi:MAG: hypothetical protein FWF28_00080 [Micrococcales bacterium]|nr:hypothetical protein [Micrococcales bacterium]
MIGEFRRFDMTRRPTRQWRMLTPLTWAVAYPRALWRRSRIDTSGLPRGLRPPYFLLCNHNAFLDFTVTTKVVFPHRANYVVAVDGFIRIEGLLRRVGGIGTRKFVHNAPMVRNMLMAREFGDVMVMYPEARYALCGTGSALPAALGRMVKSMDIPVVTLIMHGHHVDAPVWRGRVYGLKPIHAEAKLLLTLDEVRALPVAEINARLAATFTYDDFAWQKANGIRVRDPHRAEGLHKVLYQCPACRTEYRMRTAADALSCGACGKVWHMSELGELAAESGPTEFSHIPDWYEWERANVAREVETGAYSVNTPVRIESLPNSKGFVTFGEPGRLVHDMNGFTLTGVFDGKPFTLTWPVASLIACHIEYNYKKRGDCVDLSTLDDSFYLFPQGSDVAVTKIALATEELHKRRAETRKAA